MVLPRSISLRAAVLVAFAILSFSLARVAYASGQESAQAAPRPDSVIESDVVAAITASPVLDVQPITATTVGGAVTLSGSVDDAASKELAQTVVSKVQGVASVVNNLDVVPIGAPAASGSVATDQQQPAQPQNPQDQQSGQQQSGQEQSGQQAEGDQQEAPGAGYPPPPHSARAPYSRPPARQGQYSESQPGQVEPVLIPQGTLLTVRLNEPLDSRRLSQGAMFEASSARDIFIGGSLAIPRGATLEGQVVEIRSVKGSLSGSASLSLKLNSLILEGRSYPLDSDVWVGNGPGKGGYTAGNTIAGAALGAAIGGIAGGGAGAAIGATVGGATGATASSASSGRVILPPETMLTFHLSTPVTVVPVSSQEAQRLASSQRNPNLERRPGYPRPPMVYGYPYGYPYAYVYPYRPYYYPRYRAYYR